MKKITIMGFFVGILSMTMNAQLVNSSRMNSRVGSQVKSQMKSTSIEELLERLHKNGNQTGVDSQEFTSAERQTLATHFRMQNEGDRSSQAVLLSEGFDDITTLPAAGYTFVNVSDAVGLTDWFQGNDGVFPSHSGVPTSYIGANFNNSGGTVINNFMFTPVLNLENGDEITFWTRTTTASAYPDRLEVRLDPTGANTDPTGPANVGSYTELLLSVNPSLTVGGYPDVWTEFTATVSGLTGPTNTRIAFRYWVTNAGTTGTNSDYIGIDSLTITEGSGSGSTPSTAYALNLRASCSNDFGTFSVNGPYTINPISTNTSSIYTGDFDGSGNLYALEANATNGNLLVKIDIMTGTQTTIGPLTNMVGSPTGLAWNEANQTMYASDLTTIYTIDLSTGATTVIGTTGNSTGIWLAIDSGGNAFMADIGDDNLYSINLNTGAGTLIGALGFNINFAQDADFDPDTGILYMAAYIGGGVNFWASVDTATGVATTLGSVNSDCAELGIVAIKGNPTCAKPTALTVTNITETTADLSWMPEPNASNGYIWYVFEDGKNPQTATPVATGTTSFGTNSATVMGLQNTTSYDFYVVSDCDTDGLSGYAGPVSFDTLMPPPPNDKIENSINVGALGFPYLDPSVAMPGATIENGTPSGCDITGATGVWYHFTTTQLGSASASISTPGGTSAVTFFMAPGENSVETDLILVPQTSNHCGLGTSSSIDFVANQTYYVFVMNDGAVTDIEIDATIIGIQDNFLEGFTFYPNPTNGNLTLSSTNTIEMVSIYSLLGQKVVDEKLNSPSATIDTSVLSSGTYIMKVTINGQTGVYKFLKE